MARVATAAAVAHLGINEAAEGTKERFFSFLCRGNIQLYFLRRCRQFFCYTKIWEANSAPSPAVSKCRLTSPSTLVTNLSVSATTHPPPDFNSERPVTSVHYMICTYDRHTF